MLPDFSQLRKQPRDRNSKRSSNPSKDKGFASPKSSQQFNKQSAPTSFDEPDSNFFALWLTQPSWSPIIKKPDGWITIVNHQSGKKVPLVLGTIESYFRRNIPVGKRFGRLTNYLMIDVDTGSPFHPRNGGLQPILDAMESLGLCRYLLVRSSNSEGLHIYFPLAEAVSSWGLACAAHAALTAAGVTVAAGICELFPNKKAFNAEHNGHRLPLQNDSFILDSDFRCISNGKAVFLAQWHTCAAGQDDQYLAQQLTEKLVSVPQPVSASALPPIAWTGKGQSNEVMKKLTNYGHEVIGHKTIQALANWIVAIAPQLPGFVQFASRESKNDLTRRNWAYRWAKSHFKAARFYKAKSSHDHNATVAAEALERLMVALSKIVIVGKIVIRTLWRSLSDISRELFGVGFGWKLFQKHRQLILETVSSSRKLGLSSSNEEDKSSFSSKSVEPEVSRAGREPKKGLAELSTARCVTTLLDKLLSASSTPMEGTKSVVNEPEELAMGTAVSFQTAGSATESVQTRVTGKVMQPDGRLLYRLEACAEGQPLLVSRDRLSVVSDSAATPNTLRATAAQLLQVLGKACPFVGPGLWTVRREEVSPLVWQQLRRLVGQD